MRDHRTNLRSELVWRQAIWIVVAVLAAIYREWPMFYFGFGVSQAWALASWHAKAINRGGWR